MEVPATATTERTDRLGLPATTALVVGGIVATGIFTVPAAIAVYGWLSVPAFAIVSAGSLAIALSFARLVRRTRRSGGPYAYARDAFGEFTGFLAAWTYWIQGWTGHATIAVAGVGYAATLFDGENIGSVEAKDGDVGRALPAACALLLFSFLGMEGAAVATNRVRDPEPSP